MRRMLLGVGNRLRRDDGAGPSLAAKLSASCWIAIDCGTSLENTSGIVSRVGPDLLVIADAARMGLEPGEVRRLPRPEADRMLVSTHGLPLAFFLDRLGDVARCIELLGIEPADVSLGEGLSEAVGAAVERWAVLLADDPERLASVPALGEASGAGRLGVSCGLRPPD